MKWSRPSGQSAIDALRWRGGTRSYLDAAEWKNEGKACTVRRFWAGANDEHGRLIHRRDGKWAFSCTAGDDSDDEPIFRFDHHVFRSGEYVSVTEHDGVTRPFKVTEVMSEPKKRRA